VSEHVGKIVTEYINAYDNHLGGLSPISTRCNGSSPFSGPAKGVTTNANGMPVFFRTSIEVGIAHNVTLMSLGEQFPLSIALNNDPDRGGTFLIAPERVVYMISFCGFNGRGISFVSTRIGFLGGGAGGVINVLEGVKSLGWSLLGLSFLGGAFGARLK
jgi:hypothetical protein